MGIFNLTKGYSKTGPRCFASPRKVSTLLSNHHLAFHTQQFGNAFHTETSLVGIIDQDTSSTPRSVRIKLTHLYIRLIDADIPSKMTPATPSYVDYTHNILADLSVVSTSSLAMMIRLSRRPIPSLSAIFQLILLP